jgi:hypothetical protein
LSSGRSVARRVAFDFAFIDRWSRQALKRADRNNFIGASEVCHNARPMQQRRSTP